MRLDAGLFHPCFFAFLAISMFNIFESFLNPFMDFDRVNKNLLVCRYVTI